MSTPVKSDRLSLVVLAFGLLLYAGLALAVLAFAK
jgi:hypothetical protein